ncbi:Rpn family recombination-promoting nuclease/putative transposase [Hyalangium rubrum]|uniref:Rpn family recombination-promoting nuclease/putative transposase n=1 Tax=Hyalangium rubrum TaxID=3103134 RepID=A0ABU5H806_9BACT|nr:Rpn family recombination-promoting nuclease/putative transposase [Hyalangium sp. s54d21]MDY7228220.1 Rpn family recombination-promoting nuclease/putative transposase [Hyalangium sp. s54d21]
MSGPHDLFVRFTFGHPERAAAELRAVLPPEVVAQVDWSTLNREPSSVVDPELRETESDLLFSARVRSGRSVLFYVLLEHQSSVDPWMALRMLRYVVRQLDHWRKQHPERVRLPVIIPLVMYHGPEGAWSAPRRIEELFDFPQEGARPETWKALVPHFGYRVDDLTSERAEAWMARPGPPLVRLALLALRFGRTLELAQQLPGWTALFEQVSAAPGGVEEVGTVVHYLLRVGTPSSQTLVVGMLRSVVGVQRAEELMGTWGEEFLEKGRQQGWLKGLAEGQAKGRAEGVLRILATRGVQVDDTTRQRILACTDLATLDRWFDRALAATRLSDVLEDKGQ